MDSDTRGQLSRPRIARTNFSSVFRNRHHPSISAVTPSPFFRQDGGDQQTREEYEQTATQNKKGKEEQQYECCYEDTKNIQAPSDSSKWSKEASVSDNTTTTKASTTTTEVSASDPVVPKCELSDGRNSKSLPHIEHLLRSLHLRKSPDISPPISRPRTQMELHMQDKLMEKLQGKFKMPKSVMDPMMRKSVHSVNEVTSSMTRTAIATTIVVESGWRWSPSPQVSNISNRRNKQQQPLPLKPVLANFSRIGHFQAPFRRLPTPWHCRPETPLQRIYGSVVRQMPFDTERERMKVIDQAVHNGHMYRKIKKAQSNYNRKEQLTQFKKHQAFIRYKGPVANVDGLENKRNRPPAPPPVYYCYKPITTDTLEVELCDLTSICDENSPLPTAYE